MKRTAIPNTGIYQDAAGRFWCRPTVERRRTWRLLKAISLRKAVVEAGGLDLSAKADSFANLAKYWSEAGHPGRNQKPVDEPGYSLLRSLDMLRDYFGRYRADEIRMKHLPPYAEWRRKKIQRSDRGGRTVDLDMVVLSNILRFGVRQGHLEVNYIRSDRPRYATKVRHAREVMPQSAEVIHRLAAEFFGHPSSEVNAWMALFSEMTGCRTSELLRLRRDARTTNEAGFVEWLTPAEIKERSEDGDDTIGHLYLGRRSKHGMNPWARIGPEFAEMLKAFEHWHKNRFKRNSQWYFPGHIKGSRLGETAFIHALNRVVKNLNAKAAEKLDKITPHGFRAFYATKRLRDGARPVEIAAEMGDKTVALIENIYAANAGGKRLWWTPADGLPTWNAWFPPEKPARIGLSVDSSKKPSSIKRTKPL